MDDPHLRYRDPRGRTRLHRLGPEVTRVTIGRSQDADVALPWDDRVSRLHARLELVGDDPAADWTVVDDGSRNGILVNGERVRGRARLAHGDTVAIGSTAIAFRVPSEEDSTTADPGQTTLAPGQFVHETTIMSRRPVTRHSLSDSQRRVLAALAAPGGGEPPSDEQLAARLFLAPATIARHVHELAVLYGVADLPADAQRAQIVELARRSGIVGPG